MVVLKEDHLDSDIRNFFMKKVLIYDNFGILVKTKYLFKALTTGRLKELTASLPKYWAAYYVPFKGYKVYYTRWQGAEPYIYRVENFIRR